jgi:hypothetical protein
MHTFVLPLAVDSVTVRVFRSVAFALCASLALVAPELSAQQPSSEPVNELSGPALVSALRAGGLVLYFRHTSTDFGQSDDGMTSFDDCAKQRRLTDKGRTEARAIGAAVRELQIPVDRVFASPFCRTVETAMLAFGKAEKTLDLRGWPASSEDPNRYAALAGHLATSPIGATNVVLVGHGNPFRAVAGPPHLMEGEAAVIRPLGGKRFEIAARIPLQKWTDLLKLGALPGAVQARQVAAWDSSKRYGTPMRLTNSPLR